MKLKGFIQKLWSSEYFKNVLTLSSGTTAAQAISIGTAPILYRIYSKEDYGTLGLYMAIVGVLGAFSTFHYSEAILLEKEDSDAETALTLNLGINLLFSLFTILAILFFAPYLAKLFANPSIELWLWLLPISIFFSGLNQIYRTWANRKRKYRVLALNSIILALLIPSVSISVGIFNKGPLGLFLGLLISHIIPPLVLYLSLNNLRGNNRQRFDYSQTKAMVIRYADFPKFSLPSDLLNRTTNQLPVFMISSYMGPGAVGIYNLSVRMLGLPVQLIASSISEVFRQKASHDFAIRENCIKVYNNTVKTLFSLSIIPFIVLVFFAPDIFGFVFGEEWRQAGVIAQILATLYGLKMIVSPVSFLYYIVKKQKEELLITIYFVLSSYFIFRYSIELDFLLSLKLYALNYSLIYLYVLYRTYKFSKGDKYSRQNEGN